MPRPRCEASVEAENRFHTGAKLVDIAHSMGVPEGTVRRWKSDQDWDGKKAEAKRKALERSKKRNPSGRKRGAQPGHPPQGGGKPGNINGVITGTDMILHEGTLSDDEKVLYYSIVDQDAERRESLLRHLAIQRVREMRLLKDVQDIRSGEQMLTRRSVTHSEPTGKRTVDGREIIKVLKISREQENRAEMLLRFEDALTRVQAEIRRTEDSIRQFDASKLKDLASARAIENNLFDAIAGSAERDVKVDEIHELRKTATTGDDVVETPGIPTL